MSRTSILLISFLLIFTNCLFAEEQLFQSPSVEGQRLDLCLVWGNQCGQPAADAWCKLQGFESASSWKLAKAVGPTVVLTDHKKCDQPSCDGFESITCARATTALPRRMIPNIPKTVPDDSEAEYSEQKGASPGLGKDRAASWVDVNEQKGLIGQIFFETGKSDLDDKAMAEILKIKIAYEAVWAYPSVPVTTFQFRGFSDHRRFPGEGGNKKTFTGSSQCSTEIS